MLKAVTLLCVGILLVPAVCEAVIVDFSDLSSDQTDPSALNARWRATVAGDELTVEVFNLTSAPNGFTISELYFSLQGDVDARTLGLTSNDGFVGATIKVEESVPGKGTAPGVKAGGFGRFDVRIDLGQGNTGIPAGWMATFVISGVSGLDDNALDELSENPPGNTGVVAVTEFTEGPSGDSAFGNGSIVSDPTPDVEISDFQVVAEAFPLGGRISWRSAVEVGVDYYVIERQSIGRDFEPLTTMTAIAPELSGIYYAYDDITGPGTYTYRVTALLLDGSRTEVLGEASVVVPSPDVQISNLQAVAIAGGARVSWTSTAEVGVDYYVLDRSIVGVFEAITAMTATGSGINYSYDDITDPGTYTYRVRAVFWDGSQTTFPGVTVEVR